MSNGDHGLLPALTPAVRLVDDGEVEPINDAEPAAARVEGRCGELVLRRTEDGHYEVIANGVFLMDTRDGTSERLLVTAAADRMLSGSGHVLIGGLGVGFSLAAAVVHPRVHKITVVEREPAMIEWARGSLVPFNEGALDDPRVVAVQNDLLDHLRATAERYDAICVDVDNGPHWTVTEGNRRLYEDAGLHLIERRLTKGGVLAVWSASASADGVPEFAERLRARFDDVEVLSVPVPGREPDAVFVARQQYARTV